MSGFASLALKRFFTRAPHSGGVHPLSGKRISFGDPGSRVAAAADKAAALNLKVL